MAIVRRRDIDYGNYRKSKDGIEWQWGYRVVGNFDEATCLTASDSETGMTIPAIDSPHPTNTDATVSMVEVKRVGLSPGYGIVFDVDITWSTKSFDVFDVFQPRYKMTIQYESRNRDSDVKGRPFINAVGDPIKGEYSELEPVVVLQVFRREPFFDAALAVSIGNRVNESAMTVNGYSIEKEQMCCIGYNPTEDQRVGSSSPVQTMIEFRIRDGYKPWQASFRNHGMMGYDLNELYGPLAPEKSTEQVTEPVLLGPTGKPLYGKYRVLPGANEAFDAPLSVTAFMEPDYPEIRPSDTSPPFYKLYFQTKYTFNFTGFIPGIM